MPRFFFVAEDQLDALEAAIDELPRRQTKVVGKLLDLVKETQQLPPPLMQALLKGPPAQGQGEEREPPKGPPAAVGKPDAASAPAPPAAAQVAKGANATAVMPKE